jgi:hypothetical protein
MPFEDPGEFETAQIFLFIKGDLGGPNFNSVEIDRGWDRKNFKTNFLKRRERLSGGVSHL